MDGRKSEDEPKTEMKRRSINKEEQQPYVISKGTLNHSAIAAVPNEENEESRPQIFKLDVDCVQEMFDYLSIKDIESVSETCTRMQRIAGDFFQPHLAALELYFYKNKFTRIVDGKISTKYNSNVFSEFARKLYIYGSVNTKGYRLIGLHCKSLKQITFYGSQFNAAKIEHIRPILSKIETVKFYHVDIVGEFYESFLQFCPNLKHLRLQKSISNPIKIIGTNNEWLLRGYPALEHLDLFSFVNSEIPELRTFFNRNSNLREFSIDIHTFSSNMNVMLQAKMNLQVLAVFGFDGDMCRHLNQLHDQGFYQRLHLYSFRFIDQQSIDRICSWNVHVLEKLHLHLSKNVPNLNLNFFRNIKELGFHAHYAEFDEFKIDLQSTAKSLVSLERLYFLKFNFEMIEPFIEYSAKLKAIRIENLTGENFIDLSAWNEKRKKLVGAKKVSIYFDEKVYLAMKWSKKTTDFKMIEVKRAQSFDSH